MARLSCCSFLPWLAITTGALAAPPTPHYVGSKACYGCHEQIYRSFTKTDMGRSMRPAADLDRASFPTEATVSVPGSNRTLRVVGDRTGWRQSESEPNVFVDEHQLDYAVGSGTNGVTFLVRRGNYLFEAPLSYYSKANKWDLSPGYEYGDYGFSRSAPEGCILCHSGRAEPVLDHPGAYRDPPFQELAIGCENCHGPGEATRTIQSAAVLLSTHRNCLRDSLKTSAWPVTNAVTPGCCNPERPTRTSARSNG